jgi:putative heme-binding domain-containing protein
MTSFPARLLTVLIGIIASNTLFAAEPWADGRIEVTDGLWGWWDATVQPAGHESLGLRRLESESTTNIWLDSSGNGHHFVQRISDSQPTFVTGPRDQAPLAAYRFDGTDDHFQQTGLNARWEEATVFIVTSPQSNPGFFRAFLAGNQMGFNDYTTGFTVDFGGQASPDFSSINLEGIGFGGAADLLDTADEMGTWHVIEARLANGPGGVSLVFDGEPQQSRDRFESELRVDELTLAARAYSNNEQPVSVGSYLQGDIAEVLIYDRALSDDESAAVNAYLSEKYAPLLEAENAAVASSLLSGGVRPEVQFLVPGFDVFTLPLEINNCNDLFYDADGRLFLLGYDGRVRVAVDSDGDGLEDEVTVWWDEPAIRMPMGFVPTPEGDVLVSSAGRIVRLSDTDGDGVGDTEETVVEGWMPPENFSGGVDAVGLALDDEGRLFFALGTSDYGNAYLMADGESHYDLHGDRGTIQMVSPDFSEREAYCTGVRFNVSIAFNNQGDLFGSEQEGATWLPNGNPFDELLHLQPDRHYGFPPRHPLHLPDVIDEPSTYDYGPQHQSTCGLTFNRVSGDTCFGPARWWDDALVSGYSRGNLYRTTLFRDEAGYLATNQILAVMRHLTVDTCVAPDGSLVIATHSGGPDWGSGPEGIGRLYKVRSQGDVTRPVALWPASPTELHVAFDRPLTLDEMQLITEEPRVTIGHSLREGDDFEVQRPGYAVVQDQQQEPVDEVAVHSVQITPDRRNLVLLTDPIVDQRYSAVRVSWRRPFAEGAIEPDQGINIGCSRNGVLATWTPDAVQPSEPAATSDNAAPSGPHSLWWPHLNPQAVAEFMDGSQQHGDFLASLEQAGTLKLQCRVDVHDMLRPAVQPGSQIDYEWPAEIITLVIESDRPFAGRHSIGIDSRFESDANHRTEIQFPAGTGLVDLEFELQTEAAPPVIHVSWYTNESSTLRPLSTARLYVPWMVPDTQATSPRFVMPTEIAGGDWEHGRELFFSEQALCSKCHRMRGEGGQIGPDLSNLAHRDYGSVMRDVLQPSFAINPDHLTYAVSLLDGRVLTGTLRRPEEGVFIIGDNTGKETIFSAEDVDEMLAQPTSTMPANIREKLNENDLRDLLKFLQAPAPTLPADLVGEPPTRTAEDIAAVLAGAPDAIDASRALDIVLVAGDKDHGPGEHDYPAWQRSWSTILGEAENVTVDTAWVWPSDEQWESADIIAFYRYTGFDEAQGAKLDAFLERGGGAVFIHWAVGGGEELADRIGLSAASSISFRHGPLDLIFDRDRGHPVTRNFHHVHFLDESYWNMFGDLGSINTLGIGYEEGEPCPLFWTREVGQGKVFVSILGHYSWTFDDPLFRILIFRGMLWSADENVDRFNDLATMGLKLEEGD